MLPAVPETFAWAQEPWGPALRCTPLNEVAPHLFTTRNLQLSSKDGWHSVERSIGVRQGNLVTLAQVHGREVVVVRKGGARPEGRPEADVLISDDPDATWAQISESAFYDAETYASWQDDAARSDWVVPQLHSLDDLRNSGRYLVLTPRQCIERVVRDQGITLHPLMGGISPQLAWESLHLFESEVLPHVRG